MTDRELLEQILEKVNNLDTEVSDIKLHLENVTDKNIRIIAEGHIDLSRKLNEVIHITSDIKAYHELQDILVREHDEKLKKII